MRYFVTGGTGFLGRFLLPHLLTRGDKVYLLVRKASLPKFEQMRARLGASEQQLVAVAGDLNEKRLGVSRKRQDKLRGRIDHFFHLAAIYDIAADAEAQIAANVDGTRHALALARALDAGCFHHVSSIAAAGLYPGTFSESMFDEATGLNNPYFRTKHDAEGLVRKEKRLRWRIYRPGMVVGDTRGGYIDRVDGPYYMFSLVKKLCDAAPAWIPLPVAEGGCLNLVPVDYVVRAMDYLAHLEGHDRECFFLTHATGIRVGELLRCLSAAAGGPRIYTPGRVLPDVVPQSLIQGLLDSPVSQYLARLSEPLGIPAQALEFAAYPTRFDSVRTRYLLEQGGIVCPDFEDYAHVVWGYWERHFAARGDDAGGGPLKVLGDWVGGPSLEQVVTGRVAVVTGASSGIGRELALKLARAGAIVVLVARKPEKLQEVVDEIRELGGEAHAYPCDIADLEACEHFIERVLDEHGQVDILVNNAGRSIRRSVEHSFDRFHDFQRTMQLNYFGALKLIMGFAPSMLERESGHIVNISSIGVLTSPPRFSAYVASKAALDAFSWCAAAEFAHRNVHFTTINMPLVRTPMIAPTKLYDAFPTLTPAEAADLVADAIIKQPKREATLLGIAGAVAEAVAPNISEFWLNQAFRLFPESASAQGLREREAAAVEREIPTRRLEVAQRLFAQVLRGVHW